VVADAARLLPQKAPADVQLLKWMVPIVSSPSLASARAEAQRTQGQHTRTEKRSCRVFCAL